MTASPNPPLEISMIMLGVENLSKSVAFYRDVMSLELRNQTDEFAFFAAGPISLVLSAPLGHSIRPRAGALEVIFPVKSVQDARDRLVQKGRTFTQEPHHVTGESWAASIADPDGHLLTLFGPK